MLKKIALFALILLPLGAFAQEKIAYFYPSEIFVIMPEYKQMQDSLQKTQVGMQKELEIIREDYVKKYQAFMNESEGLSESIKTRRLEEIQDLEQRASVYSEQFQQELVQLQNALAGAIEQKVRDAVKAVATANHFLYVLDANSLWFISPNAINATSLVQKQLKL